MSHNLRRDLGVVESYAVLIGVLIGAGIFKVTGVAWELTGPSVVIGYAIHVAGVRWFGRIQVWMCVVLGLSIVVLVVPGFFAVHMSNYRPFFTGGVAGFAAALPPLFFAYAGFESLAHTAGEVKDS